MIDKSSLRDYLRENCNGRYNSVTVTEMAYRFATSPRKIRAMLRELSLEGYPIATSTHPPAGVFWATEAIDLDQNWANLNSRVLRILERMRAINRTKTREFIKGQLELFG